MHDPEDAVTVVFRDPVVQPGTPEAEEAGCLCRFESNLEAGFLAVEHADEGHTMVVIHNDCPLHEVVHKPMDDVVGDDG